MAEKAIWHYIARSSARFEKKREILAQLLYNTKLYIGNQIKKW